MPVKARKRFRAFTGDMDHSEEETMVNEKRFRAGAAALVVFAVIGALFAGYLLYIHDNAATHGSALFKICSVGVFDCGRVAGSRYSIFLGVPVAGYGLLFYLFLIFLFAISAISEKTEFRHFLYNGIFLISLAGVVCILPLAYISAFKIRAFCLFCLFTWICNIGVLASIVIMIRSAVESVSFREFLGINLRFFDILQDNVAPVAVVMMVFLILLGSLISLSLYFKVRSQVSQIQEGMKLEEEIMSQFYLRPQVNIDLKGVPLAYGSPNAKVTVVEYFNFDCPACRRSSAVMESLAIKYRGKVRFYMKHFPLDSECNRFMSRSDQGLACKAALVSIALRGTDKYKPFVDSIMRNNNPLSLPLIEISLANAGITREKLQKLMSEGAARKILLAEIEEAARFRPDGTPTFVINGRDLPSGLPPFAFFDRLIQMEVSRVYGTR